MKTIQELLEQELERLGIPLKPREKPRQVKDRSCWRHPCDKRREDPRWGRVKEDDE